MVNPLILDILFRRIVNGEINPKTGEPMTLTDIKIQEYREAVEAMLNERVGIANEA